MTRLLRMNQEKWLTFTAFLLAGLYFFVPAGRFQGTIFGVYASTGYNAYKLIPIPFLAWMAWRGWQKNWAWMKSDLWPPLWTLFLISIIAGIASPDPWQALADALEIFFYLGLFLLLIDFPWTPSRLQIVGAGFVIGNLYLVSVAAKQFLSMHHSGTPIRLSATFDHPNALGAYGIIGLPLLVWMLAHVRGAASYFWTTAAAAGLSIAVLLSQSRAAMVALLVGLIVAVALANQNRKRLLAGALLGFVILAACLSPQILTRFRALNEEWPDVNRANRPAIWYGMMQAEIPALGPFGVGLGPVSMNRFGDWIPSDPAALPYARVWGPHSTPLAWLTGGGLLGIFALFWLFRNAWQRLRMCDSSTKTALGAGLIAFALSCLFQDPLLMGNIPIVWISVLAIADRMAGEQGVGVTP